MAGFIRCFRLIVWQKPQEHIQSFRKDRPYGPEGIHRILRQATGGTSEREHALPDFLWN